MDFSLLMAVYKNDNLLYFKRAVQSILNQSLKPKQIVLVEDGPLDKELASYINELQCLDFLSVKLIKLQENCGLGTALAIGLENCSYEIVARMDSDDISRFDRFEKQIFYLKENPQVDIVGSFITEFAEDERVVLFKKKLPITHLEIKKYAKYRSPLNHVTVVFRKSSVLRAGNYHRNCQGEDWCLWVRMLQKGCIFANIPEFLVNVSVGYPMFKRRGNLKLIAGYVKLQTEFLNSGFINYIDFIFNLIARLFIIIIPNQVRSFVYKVFFRSS